MKRKTIFIAILLFLALPALVWAQDDTATGTLDFWGQMALAWVGGGYIASMVMDWIKRLAWLPDKDRSRIGGAAADLIVTILSAAISYGIVLLTPLAGQLDALGFGAFVAQLPAAIVAFVKWAVRKQVS